MSHSNQLNDVVFRSLRNDYGYTGALNDMLLQFYQANGATANQINDAEMEFLSAVGAVGAQLNDMWFNILRANGYEGALNDMLLDFWRGELWTNDPEVVNSPPWTDNLDGSYTADGTLGGPGNRIIQDTEEGDLVGNKTYTVSFTVSGRTQGAVRIILVSDSLEVGRTADVSVNGSYTEDVVLDAVLNVPIGRIAIDARDDGGFFLGTISNISVRRKFPSPNLFEALKTESNVDITDEALDPITVPI